MSSPLGRYSPETMDMFEEPARPAARGGIDRSAPLAARMRPRSLDEFVGQQHLVAPGKPLRRLIESGTAGNVILWGGPGTGKTTLAHLIAQSTKKQFVPFSAVSEGVPRIREIVAEAERLKRNRGEGTLLFMDEAHALNKSQQDTLLPHVESGLLQLIAATTENVSFELRPAILSRCKVFRLEPLTPADVRRALESALEDTERGLGEWELVADDVALDLVGEYADGDARRGLTILETAAALVSQGGHITEQVVRDAAQTRVASYDKGQDARYELLSALQKSIRNSDPQAALYYLARMIEGGEEHRVICRRLAVIAAEDVGLADPQALPVTMAAIQNMEFVGPPEGWLAVAEAVLYLATAPKSARSYMALGAARELARQTMRVQVPKHLQNAPTALMRSMGIGEGYDYPFNHPNHVARQRCLPEELAEAEFYEPSGFGYEKQVAERLRWWAKQKGLAPNDGE